MVNKTMEAKLDSGACVAVDKVGVNVSHLFPAGYGQVFELNNDIYKNIDCDLCVAETESWIWSVGERKSDGKIFASTTANFYDDEVYNCIWLR